MEEAWDVCDDHRVNMTLLLGDVQDQWKWVWFWGCHYRVVGMEEARTDGVTWTTALRLLKRDLGMGMFQRRRTELAHLGYHMLF